MSGVPIFPWQFVESETDCPNFTEGELQAIEKVRSEKKALQYLIDKVAEGHHAGKRKSI